MSALCHKVFPLSIGILQLKKISLYFLATIWYHAEEHHSFLVLTMAVGLFGENYEFAKPASLFEGGRT
jgi:hypothetical protein